MKPPNRTAASPRRLAWLPAGLVLAAAALGYVAVASNTVVNGRLEFGEVSIVVKAWWYTTGVLAPFGPADPLPGLPLLPLALGAIQTVIGPALEPARLVMIGLGALTAVLLFLLCRKLTAHSLASAAAVLIYAATPATAYGFSIVSPVALAALLHVAALWLLVLSVGRPRLWLSLALGATLAALALTSGSMIVPGLALLALFTAAAGRGRWRHAGIAVAASAAVLAAASLLLPEAFLTVLLNQPALALIRDLLGFAAPSGLAAAPPSYAPLRIGADALEGALLPYGGTVMLCLLLLALTARGPRALWVVPGYFLIALAAIVVFQPPGCEACVATAPSQVSAVGALGAAMTLAFLARMLRQKSAAATPAVIGGALAAVALNTFAPGLATRPMLHFFPAEMLKQARPAAEQEDVAALMRFIGQNVPPGPEPILLMHRLPALPYAVHMAGRRFPAVSLEPLAALHNPPAGAAGARREAALAAIERTGGWSAETLRRWIERDYELIVWQDGVLTLDPATAALLASAFDRVASTEFRGATLTLYKRKA
jgi:hypothetical protein